MAHKIEWNDLEDSPLRKQIRVIIEQREAAKKLERYNPNASQMLFIHTAEGVLPVKTFRRIH